MRIMENWKSCLLLKNSWWWKVLACMWIELIHTRTLWILYWAHLGLLKWFQHFLKFGIVTVTAHSIFLIMFHELLWNTLSLVLLWKFETWYSNHVGGVPIMKFETCFRKCSLCILSVPITHVHCTSIVFSCLPCCGLTTISSISEVACILMQEMHILNTVFLG